MARDDRYYGAIQSNPPNNCFICRRINDKRIYLQPLPQMLTAVTLFARGSLRSVPW